MKYYVYIRPGYIRYFETLAEAEEFARYYGAEVKEL